jgi:hypothetical protein
LSSKKRLKLDVGREVLAPRVAHPLLDKLDHGTNNTGNNRPAVSTVASAKRTT